MAGHKTSKKGSKLSKGISYSFKHDDFAKFRKYQKQKYGSKGSKDSKDNKHRNLNRQISNKKLQKSINTNSSFNKFRSSSGSANERTKSRNRSLRSRSRSNSSNNSRSNRFACKSCVPSHHYNNNILQNNPYALYSKALPHDIDGYVNKYVYIQFYKALKNQSIEQLNYVPLGGITKLLDPPSAWSGDVQNFVRRKRFCLPKLSTAIFAANIIEVYVAAAARDIEFLDYLSDVQIAKSVVDIANLSNYRGPTISNLTIFRGDSSGDLTGPYVSQLLLLDYEQGGIIYNQRYPTFTPVDYMTTLANALSVQNGIVNEILAPFAPARYIINGRDLAAYVREDSLIQPYIRAVGVLYNIGAPFNSGIPINSSFAGFVNFGRPDIECSLGAVTRLAALAAFCQKFKALYIRPEEVGIIINRIKSDLNLIHNPTLNDEALDNAILGDIFNAYGNYLLPQAYPEGSPASPSYPSLHAVVAGACITVLKFFFGGQWNLNLVEPDVGGNALVSTGMMSNLSNELDKLASNIGFARVFAGVNYRMDVIGGIRLGEQVGLKFLKNHAKNYPQNVKVQITLYNGDIAHITNF